MSLITKRIISCEYELRSLHMIFIFSWWGKKISVGTTKFYYFIHLNPIGLFSIYSYLVCTILLKKIKYVRMCMHAQIDQFFSCDLLATIKSRFNFLFGLLLGRQAASSIDRVANDTAQLLCYLLIDHMQILLSALELSWMG